MLARAIVGNTLILFFSASILAQENILPFSWDQIPDNQTTNQAIFSWENAKQLTPTNQKVGFDWNGLRVSTFEPIGIPGPQKAVSGEQLFNWDTLRPAASNASTVSIQERPLAKCSVFPDSSATLTQSAFPIQKAAMVARVEAPTRTGLELLQMVKQDETPAEQIRIRPMNSLTNTDTSKSLKSSPSTAKYIGPLGSGEDLFRNLNISNRYQTVGGIHLEETKIDSAATPYTWASPAFAHRPLYFEQPNLERYGIGHRKILQPWASGAHFYGSVLLMPYKFLTQHPQESVYTLGNQRPGDCVCYQRRTLLGQSYFGEVCKYWEEYSGY